MTPRPDDPRFQWRTRNPGRVLSNALQRFEDRVLALLAQAGWPDTRRTHINLTRHLDLQGTRITELARRAAMTNGAMSELIDQCHALGLVERVLDPLDRRARVVRFTDHGLRWLEAFGRALAQAEREMARAVGREPLAAAMAALALYGTPATPDGPDPRKDAAAMAD